MSFSTGKGGLAVMAAFLSSVASFLKKMQVFRGVMRISGFLRA